MPQPTRRACRTPFLKLEGHSKGVLTCDWSSTYKAVASGGADKSVCVFNPFSGKRQAVMTGHAATVTDVAVNDGDRQIISLSAVRTPSAHELFPTAAAQHERWWRFYTQALRADGCQVCNHSSGARTCRTRL